jgi:RNA polymerase sigma-70 factor (ECF subfamily)
MNRVVASGGDGERQTAGEAFESLLAAARAGAPWAFERFYRLLAPAVVGYLRLQGAAEPEDLTSDVFLKVFAGVARFSGSEEQFRSWVFTIAHHRLIDDRRRLARRPRAADGDPADLATPLVAGAEDEALRRLSLERVRALCDRLAPDQRDVLLLRMVADLTLEQTAEALDKSVGAVKALQHRSVAALRRLVEREGVSL